MRLSTPKQKLLDGYLEGRNVLDLAEQQAIPRRSPNAAVPLSLAQEQIWLRSLRAAENPSLYSETITIHRNGPVDLATLERSFTEILRRQEAWRTSFNDGHGFPMQTVHPAPSTFEIPVLDLQSIPARSREACATRMISEQVQAPFDLRGGPLLKAMLIRMDAENLRITVIAHQAIVDGLSAYQIFPAELTALYDAFLAGEPSPYSELPIQFGDFSIWQRTWLSGDRRTEQLEYWRKRLASPLPKQRWPKRTSRQIPETSAGEVVPFTVPHEVFEAARDLARGEGVTLFIVLLASFATLLHRHTRQEDVVIGSLSAAGRKRPECEKLLGYFLNPVALRLNLTQELTFRDLLSQARQVVSEAIANDDIPFESLEEELGLSQDSDSLLRVAISLQPKSAALGNNWQVTTMDADRTGTRWDFYLAFIQRDHEFEGRVEYNRAIFDKKAIFGTIEELFWVLHEMSHSPGARLRDLCQQPARK
jgi:hypothetical protein